MRRGVDEVRESSEGCAEADGWAVQSCNEDLGVRVEGLGGVEVVGDEGGEPLLVGVGAGLGGAGDAYVGAAGDVYQYVDRLIN